MYFDKYTSAMNHTITTTSSMMRIENEKEFEMYVC